MIYENIKNQSNMKNLKVLFTVLCVACATTVWGESTTVASYSRSGTTNSTSGGTFTNNLKTATGYLQDNSTAQDYYLQILNSTAYWTTTPKTITFICKIGGGTENKTLSSDIKVEMLAKDGTVLSTTTVTGQITTAAGDDYAISVTAVNNVAGFRLYHTKTASYNVRFYSASLAYEVGSTETTNYCDVSFVDNVQGTDCSSFDMTDVAENTQIVFNSISDKPQATTGTCEQTHYHFVGWIEDGETPNETGSNVIAAGTTSIKATKDVTYKAVWAQEAN